MLKQVFSNSTIRLWKVKGVLDIGTYLTKLYLPEFNVSLRHEISVQFLSVIYSTGEPDGTRRAHSQTAMFPLRTDPWRCIVMTATLVFHVWSAWK